MPAKKSKADDQDSNDRPRKNKSKPAERKLSLILGVVGCAGLLLVGCLVGAVGGGYWYFSKSDAPKNKDAVVQNKDKPTVSAKDAVVQNKDKPTVPAKDGAKVGKDDKAKPPPAATKLKKSYDQIQLGAKFDTVAELMGNRGRPITPRKLPPLSDAAVEQLTITNFREHNAIVLCDWADAGNDTWLVVGHNLDIVTFKGYFYVVDGRNHVEHVFDPAQLKKKTK